MLPFANAFIAEIDRRARAILRPQIEPLRETLSRVRSEVADLKRQVASLQRRLAALEVTPRAPASAEGGSQAEMLTEIGGARPRFVAKGLKSMRTRLGLSGPRLALLIGVSEQSIYNWEQKKSVPRGEPLAKIAALRMLSKRAVSEQLAALNRPS